MHRREFYNESVNINNIGIETFPDLIVSRLFGFGPRDLVAGKNFKAYTAVAASFMAFGVPVLLFSIRALLSI
jgi:hypothetical protein